MRVVSLLPAATEIVAALGDLSLLVAISHECDFPPSVVHLPRVTTTPVNVGAPGVEIDQEVRRVREAGKPVIAVDAAQLRRLSPDLIITQDLCEVCAVGEGQVRHLAASLHPAPAVLALKAHDLPGIWSDIQAVGAALSLDDEAEELVLGLQGRLRRLDRSRPPQPARVLCVEWLDPLYLAGHWMPQLVAAAGGDDVGSVAGAPSMRSEWAHLAPLHPDHIFIALCGFGLDRARAEVDGLTDRVALDLLARVPTWLIDGNSYTSRPGPRVVDGAVRMQAALQGEWVPGVELWQPAEYAEHR